MIIWTPSIPLLGTVTKPNIVNYSITAYDDTTPNPIILTSFSVSNISSNLPASIIITAGVNGVIVSGDTSESFGNGKQIDYALPDGTLGSAKRIIDVPKDSYLYNYHVDPRKIETYSFTVNCYALDILADSMTYEITCLNSWNSNKIDILNIISKNY